MVDIRGLAAGRRGAHARLQARQSGGAGRIRRIVKQAAPGCDLFLIVGAPNSSNSKRLVEVALRAGAAKSVLVQRAAEIDWETIGDIRTVGLSAGASAPEVIVNEIIEAFRARYNAVVELADTVEENEHFLVNRELRSIELTSADMAFVNGE